MFTSEKHVARPFIVVISALAGSLLVMLLLMIIPLQASTISVDTLTVCPTGPPDCDYRALQAAVDAASKGDTIYVATGIYTGTGTQVVLLDKGATLSGGWDAAFTSQSGTSTIDGEGSRRGITVNSGQAAIIDRFTIQNGYTGGSGGGIYNDGVLTLINSAITSNTAESGGGIAIDYGAWAVITSTQIYANVANGGSGGGIFVQEAGNLSLSKSWVVANAASSNDGGGIYVEGGSSYIENSIIAGNEMASEGDSGGGLVFGYGGPYRIVNSHIVGNEATGRGAAIATFQSVQIEVINTLIISNTGVTGIDDKYGNDTEFSLSYCDTYGNSPDGTIGVVISRTNCLGTPSADGLDPLMIGGALPSGVGPAFAAEWMSYNYLLQSGSPAVNAGTTIGTPADDIEGNPRVDGYPDLGAYETPTTGVYLTPQAQAQQGGRGQAVSYQITLINTTATTDTFTLLVGNNVWNTVLSDAQLGPIVAGKSVAFTATVTVPLDAVWYLADTAIITATSTVSPLVYSDTASLTTPAYAPPKIDISPDILTSTQLVDETKVKAVTISNGQGVTATYMTTIRSQAQSFALAGSSSSDVASMISGDPALGDYTFTVVGDDFSFEDLKSYDGVIVSEEDHALSESEALALRYFYDSDRPVILTMEGVFWLNPTTRSNVYAVFGVTNAQEGPLEGGMLNTAHPIAQGASFSDLSTPDSDHFDEDGAVWVVKGDDDENYVLAREAIARTVIFGENFHEWWQAGNEQLIRNAIDWVAASAPLTSWLTVDPISGTIGTNDSQAISMTLDATNLQPDIYGSQITIQSNDPVTPLTAIPVTMTVLPTASMGRIEGTVADARSGAPLEATIVAHGQPYTITTDPDTGDYVFWLEQGSQTLTVTAEGYVTGTATVNIIAQQGTRLDFDLVLNVPVLAVSPTSFDVAQLVDEVTTQNMTITNNGPAPLDFNIGTGPPVAFSTVSTELYGYMVPDAWLKLVGTEDDTHVEVIDLGNGNVILELLDLDQYQTFDAYTGPGSGTFYKVASDKPVAGYQSDWDGHMTFVPSLNSGPVGMEFIFYYYRTDAFYVFAIEDADVEVYDSSGTLVASQTISAGDYWDLALPNAVYHIISTGRIAMQTVDNDAYTTVPSVDGDGTGLTFYFASYEEDPHPAALAIFAYQDANIEIYDSDSNSLLYSEHIVQGGHWWQTNVGSHRMRLESTGVVEVWTGSTQGGDAIQDLGDDTSFAGGRGGREYHLHSLMDGSVIFAPFENTEVDVDGNIYHLDKDEYLHLDGCCSFHHIQSSQPILIQTLGRDSWWDNMGTYLGGIATAGSALPPWLIIEPVTGTVTAYTSEPIEVSFDASGIDPGVYTRQIQVASNDPFTTSTSVPVRMIVLPDANTGWVEGIVTDGRTGEKLEATIDLLGEPYSATTQSVDGHYLFLLTTGSYTMQVTAADYITATVEVYIVAQQGTIQDLALVRNAPVLALSPKSLYSAQNTGEVQTQTLTIINEGPVDLDFHLTIPGKTPVQHGLVAFYPFNGNAADESDNGNDATVEGAMPATDRFGNPNSAFRFDGVDDYIWKSYDAASGLHPTEDPFAITAWFKTEASPPEEQTIVSTHFAGSGDGYHLVVDADNGFRIRCFFSIYNNDVPVFSSDAVNDGEWHHVICQWKDDVLYLYVDGQLQDTTPAVGTVAYTNEARFKIGHADNAPWMEDSWFYFEGSIDDVALYNRALSEGEIQQLFNWQGGSETPWLSAEPVSGTVPGNSSAPVRVTIDASGVHTGTYHSWIRVISNDLVTPSTSIPVSMTVLPRWDVFLPVLVKSDGWQVVGSWPGDLPTGSDS